VSVGLRWALTGAVMSNYYCADAHPEYCQHDRTGKGQPACSATPQSRITDAEAPVGAAGGGGERQRGARCKKRRCACRAARCSGKRKRFTLLPRGSCRKQITRAYGAVLAARAVAYSSKSVRAACGACAACVLQVCCSCMLLLLPNGKHPWDRIVFGLSPEWNADKNPPTRSVIDCTPVPRNR
jgi:hypothetical protein